MAAIGSPTVPCYFDEKGVANPCTREIPNASEFLKNSETSQLFRNKISITNRLTGGTRIATLVIDGQSFDLFVPGGNMENAVVNISQSVFDHGSSVKQTSYNDAPTVTSVVLNDVTLDPSNYEVSYEGNSGTFGNFGNNEITAYVKVTGKGDYKGSKIVPFTIKFNYIQGRTTGTWSGMSTVWGSYKSDIDGWNGAAQAVYPVKLLKDRTNGKWYFQINDDKTYSVSETTTFEDTTVTLTNGETLTWKAS